MVKLDGADWTSDRNDRVEISLVNGVMARKSSNIPAGGVGLS